MADEGNDVLQDLDSINPDAAGNGADNQPVAGIVQQYVRDLSVENPKAPDSFNWRDQPQMDVQFNIGARQITDELHEVELKITATSKTGEGTAYIVDLAYCGLVGMRNMPEQQQHAFLFAEAPRILFPFARRVISDAVRDAGFTPLMLDPIDFNGLYVQHLSQKRAQEGAGGGMPAAPTGDAPTGGEG